MYVRLFILLILIGLSWHDGLVGMIERDLRWMLERSHNVCHLPQNPPLFRSQ